jgi:hypothetical protein
MKNFALFIAVAALMAVPSQGTAKLSEIERANIVRGLVAELGTAKTIIPRSKKPLELDAKGAYDKDTWTDAMEEFGPAARLGDMVEITKVEFKNNKLVIQLNHGISGGRKWWHRVQVSGNSNRGSTLGQGSTVYAPGGTTLALTFEDEIPSVEPAEFKMMLKPVLDFEQRSATELYVDKLPEEFKDAIEANKAVVGMDRDMVLLARGKPHRKVRDFNDGVETEDCIFGVPPGNVSFISFEDGKVISIKDSYATVGGEVKKPDDPEQQKN